MSQSGLKDALKEQFRASLAMLKECVELTPQGLWLMGQHPRATWRIALHAVFFAHLGLSGSLKDYRAWPDHPGDLYTDMWDSPDSIEPFELPSDVPAISNADVVRYIDFVSDQVEFFINRFDIESPESGMPGYGPMTALSVLLMNLRHLQGHVGQLSERLMEHGIDTTWIGKGSLSDWKAWEEANP